MVSEKPFAILPQLLGCYRWHEMKVGNWSLLAPARCLQSRAALTVMAWGTAK